MYIFYNAAACSLSILLLTLSKRIRRPSWPMYTLHITASTGTMPFVVVSFDFVSKLEWIAPLLCSPRMQDCTTARWVILSFHAHANLIIRFVFVS